MLWPMPADTHSRESAPWSGYLPSASLMRCSSSSRIGASAGSSASSVFQRSRGGRLVAGGERRRAEIEERQRIARLGLLQALQHGHRLGRGRSAGRQAADMGLGPVGQQAGIDRLQRIGMGIGVGRLGVLAQHLPGVGEPQPAGAIAGIVLQAAPPAPRPCRGSPAGVRRPAGSAWPRPARATAWACRCRRPWRPARSRRAAWAGRARWAGLLASRSRQRSSAARLSPLCASCRPR